MLIGLDAIPLTEPKTGVGHYTFELARASAAARPADEFALAYPSRYPEIELSPEDASSLPPNLRFVRARVGPLGRRWWLFGLPRHLRASGAGLFHGTNYEVPLRAPCPTVLTAHDLSAFLHPALHVPRRAARLRRRLPLMARAATMIITPTEFVRREACELLRLDPAKVVAVAEAPREVFRPSGPAEAEAVRRKFGVAGDFLLAVGTVEPRKNLLALLRAFEDVSRESPAPLKLVVAGRGGWLNEELHEHLARSHARGQVVFTGYVTDGELRALYSSCAAFVYPSVYEGFGLPPLEAMACGAPVVASRIGAHAEVLGEEAALLVPPEDAGALARALLQVITDEGARRRLSAAGRERAARYSWARAARETSEVYDEALRRWAARRQGRPAHGRSGARA